MSKTRARDALKSDAMLPKTTPYAAAMPPFSQKVPRGGDAAFFPKECTF